MENIYQNEERYFKAKKQVADIKSFYGNCIAYVVINTGLMILNVKTSPNDLWFFWPLIGWGIGLFFHGLKAFDYSPFLGKNWEQQKIREFMDKENRRKDTWT